MKKSILFTITFLLMVICFSLISCKEKAKFNLYSCEYKADKHIDLIYFSKWIYDKNDALKARLTFNDSILDQRNLNTLYKETAQYLFEIGGGSLSILPKDCNPEIKNDTLFINYKASGHSREVGEMASSKICLEISKKKYLNYKKLKVVFVYHDSSWY